MPTFEFKIREATREDAAHIAGFQVAMALETEDHALDLATVKQGVQKIFDYPEKGFYLVGEMDGQCIASALVLYEWSDWRNGEVLWIHSVYVKPEHRQKGVFKAIYQHLKNRVLERADWKGLRLYVERENQTAQKVYRAMGMTDEHYQLFEWLKLK